MLNKLAVIISGASGNNGHSINGVYFYQDMKDGKPFYKSLASQLYLHNACKNCKWYVTGKAHCDASEMGGLCVSDESGWFHPSQASLWKVSVQGELEEQPAMTVATLVPQDLLRY